MEAPGAEVDGVESDAEEIGGNEAELGGAEADDAYDGAIDRSDHPALPELFAEQNGAENGQNAGDVIETNEGVQHAGHVVFKGPAGLNSGAGSGF